MLKRSAARASATAAAQNQRKLSAQPVDRASLELGIETVIVIAGMESCQRRAWPEAGCALGPASNQWILPIKASHRSMIHPLHAPASSLGVRSVDGRGCSSRRGHHFSRRHVEEPRAFRQLGEQGVVGAGHEDLAAERCERTEQGLATRAGRDGRPLRRAGPSGAMPLICATRCACAITSPMSSAFCSPVEARAASMPFGPWRTRRSEVWGPVSVRPAARSRWRVSRRLLRILSSASSAAVLRDRARPSRPTRASSANGKGDLSSRRATMSAARRSIVSRRAEAIAMPSSAICLSTASSHGGRGASPRGAGCANATPAPRRRPATHARDRSRARAGRRSACARRVAR